MNKKILKWFFWILMAIIASSSLGAIALARGEKISSLWFITATICCMLIGYRFYSAWIAWKVLGLNPVMFNWINGFVEILMPKLRRAKSMMVKIIFQLTVGLFLVIILQQLQDLVH